MRKVAEDKRYKIPFLKTARKHWMLLVMLAPALLYVIVFSYIPMTGIVLAFKIINMQAVYMVLRGQDWIISKHCLLQEN